VISSQVSLAEALKTYDSTVNHGSRAKNATSDPDFPEGVAFFVGSVAVS